MSCPADDRPAACDHTAAYKPLTALLLACWQREHDQRPYNTMVINRKAFAEKYCRLPDEHDFAVLTEFLIDPSALRVDNFELNYVPLPANWPNLIGTLAGMTHLSLCHCGLSAEQLCALMTAPCQMLQSLRLAGNPFGAEHVQVLVDVLPGNWSLASLDVGYCDLDAQQFVRLADAVARNRSLRCVDFARLVALGAVNCVDVAKISLILAQLMWSSAVELFELHVRHNRLDGHDIEPMVDSLRRCTHLVYLDLGANRLGPPGVRAIMEACSVRPHLLGLDVSHNGLGELGGMEIANRLCDTRIRYLDIGYNCITAAAMEAIMCKLKRRDPMRVLNIVGNEFDETVGRTLRRLLDARVLLLDGGDCTARWDEELHGFRVVPDFNEANWSGYNQRYHRTHPQRRYADVPPNLLWHTLNRRHLVVNGQFVDAIFVDARCGEVYVLDRLGRRKASSVEERYENF